MNTGWKVNKLGEICEIVGGGTPSKAIPKYYTGDIPWATVRDMKNDVLSETEFKITQDAVDNSSTNIIQKGNVIIATRVGLGKVCTLEVDTAINQDLKGVIPKRANVLFTPYLFHWFKSISETIINEGTGATVQGVKLPFINSLEIPIPPLPEQQRIVALLDETFTTLDKVKENAEKNLRNARELFESVLESVFANQDEGWEEKKLGDIALIIMGQSPKGETYNIQKVGLPLINGPVEFGPEQLSDTIVTKYTSRPTKTCLVGDLILCVRGSTTGRTNIASQPSCIGRGVGVIRAKQDIEQRFLNILIASRRNQIYKMGTGATFPNVSGDQLKGIRQLYHQKNSKVY